jgi:hypothetical protein
MTNEDRMRELEEQVSAFEADPDADTCSRIAELAGVSAAFVGVGRIAHLEPVIWVLVPVQVVHLLYCNLTEKMIKSRKKRHSVKNLDFSE